MFVIVISYGSSVDIVGPFHSYLVADEYRINLYPPRKFSDGTVRNAETRLLIVPKAR